MRRTCYPCDSSNAPNKYVRTEPTVQLIDDDARFREACARLAESTVVSVDTEFVRERTYFPQLCLIQVTGDETIYCIDVLALDDLRPLVEIFASESCEKVLHAARQDFEALLHVTGQVPNRLFDTQIAAALSGYGDQVSYATLVEEFCDVRLAKTQTRTDWSRRPLSSRQLRYAADDVRYLAEIRDALTEKLEALGRLHWAEVESEALSDAALYTPDPDEAWRRIKAARRLAGRSRPAIRHLAAWRETAAADRNRPRRWIADDRALVDIATALPDSADALRDVLGPDHGRLMDDADAILAALAAARSQPGETAPRRPDATENRKISQLMKMVRDAAVNHGLSATLLTTRREIKQLVFGRRDLAVLDGWRRELVGDALLAKLQDLAEPGPG